MTEKKLGARSIEVNGVRYKREPFGTYRSEEDRSEEDPSKVLPIISFDPTREVIGAILVWDEDKKAFRHKDAALYYKKLSDGQYVLMENQAFVVEFVVKEGNDEEDDDEEGNVSYIPCTVDDKGEVFCHYESEKLDVGKARLTLAQKEYEKLPHSFVLPGFPLIGELESIFIDAQLGIVPHQEMRYRYVLEDEVHFDTDDVLEYMHENDLEQVQAEINTYTTIVPSDALFKHFRTNTLNYLNAKENKTEADKTIIEVLEGKRGPVTSFYEFAVAIGAVEKISEVSPLTTTGKDAEYCRLATELQITKINSSMALHYYMDQYGAKELPELNLKSVNPHLAYRWTWGNTSMNSYTFYKKWHKYHRRRVGESTAMQHIFACIHRSPRWQDVSKFQAGIVPESNRGSAKSWEQLLPPTTLPYFYGPELDAFVGRQLNKLKKDNDREIAKTFPDDIRRYYMSASNLYEVGKALSTYREAMGGEENEPSGRIPLYFQGNSGHVNESPRSGLYQEENNDINDVLYSGHRTISRLETEKIVSNSGGVAAVTITPFFSHAARTVLTLGASGGPGFFIAVAVGAGITYAWSRVSQAIAEGKIEDATKILNAVTEDINRQRKDIGTRMETISQRPQMKDALIYTRDMLRNKEQLTAEEQQLLEYLEKEIENPTGNHFGTAVFDINLVENPPELSDADPNLVIKYKKALEAQAKAFNDLAQVSVEASIYSYCLNFYYSSEKQRESDNTRFNKARKNKLDQNTQARLEPFQTEGKPKCFEVVNTNMSLPFPPLLDTVTNSRCSKIVLDRVNKRGQEYFSSITTRDSYGRVLSGDSANYRAQYSREVMRSLAKIWVGEANLGLPDEHCGASNGIVTAHSIDTNPSALFDRYSFKTAREVEIKRLEQEYLSNKGVFNDEQKKKYELLTARRAKEGSQDAYTNAIKILHQLDNSSNNSDDACVLKLRLEYLSLTKKQNSGEIDKEGEERLNALKSALEAYDEVTEPKILSYASYHQAMKALDGEIKTPMSAVHEHTKPMQEEMYDFLSTVQAYMLSDGSYLKGIKISRDLTSLFPSREERLAKAGEVVARKNLEQEFIAESLICSDIIYIFAESVKQSDELKHICKINGWLNEKGEFDIDRVCQSDLPKDTGDPVKNAKARADLEEKRVCFILRAIDSHRHLLSQMKDPSASIDNYMTNANISAETKKEIYRIKFEALTKTEEKSDFDIYLQVVYAKKMCELYGDKYSLDQKADMTKIDELVAKKGWSTEDMGVSGEKISDVDSNSVVFSYLTMLLDKHNLGKENQTPDEEISKIEIPEEVQKEVTDVLKRLDEATLSEMLKNPSFRLIAPLIQTHLETLQGSTGEDDDQTLNDDERVDANAVVVLSGNAERNITTARGADGVDISYTAQRGRA